MFGEPPRSAYDLNFTLFGTPVRVHPMFWLIMVLLGTNSQTTPKSALIWLIAAFVSILVHEFGHVAAIAWYGARSHVVLHGFGGLAIQDSYWRRDPKSQIVISLAGPAAGFVLAALVVMLVRATGSMVDVRYIRPVFFMFLFEPFPSDVLNELIMDLWFCNIYWGLLNLLPIYPLDGGQASAALFQLADPRDGMRNALKLSLVTAGAMLLFGLSQGATFSAFFFGYMAYNNYQMLQSWGGGYRGSPW